LRLQEKPGHRHPAGPRADSRRQHQHGGAAADAVSSDPADRVRGHRGQVCAAAG